MMMMNFISHGTQDMYPTFLKEQRGFSDQRTAVTAIIYNLGALSGGIFFGAFSDRMGRRRSMIIALVMAVLLIPLWAFGPSGPLLVLGAFLMQFMVQGAWGVVPAHISELSPDSVRGFLPGFAYQCGVLLAGSVAWMESVFAKSLTYSTAMAMTALTVFVLGIVVIAAGKEKRASIFGGE
jgi:SHS family lactate transporter-like MFS transporter